jgi:esterase/lipase superfamily enzyme
MHREYHRWHSPSLGRDMELLLYGHAGARVLAFPVSQGHFYDWENNGLIGALSEHLHRGWLQLLCLDSVDSESWYAYHHHPGHRAWRHDQYDRYVLHEVLPFSEWKNPNPFLIVTGASFGGYHATNFALRHPERVARLLSLSGLQDIDGFTGGHRDHLTHYHNPSEFIAHEADPGRLAALRRMNIILAVGREDRLLGSNQRLSHALWSKGIWHALRVWDGMAHDWPVWERMLQLYIGGND